jgi:hypothetical protein
MNNLFDINGRVVVMTGTCGARVVLLDLERAIAATFE